MHSRYKRRCILYLSKQLWHISKNDSVFFMKQLIDRSIISRITRRFIPNFPTMSGFLLRGRDGRSHDDQEELERWEKELWCNVQRIYIQEKRSIARALYVKCNMYYVYDKLRRCDGENIWETYRVRRFLNCCSWSF